MDLDLLTKRDKKINNSGPGASQHQHRSAVVSRLPRGLGVYFFFQKILPPFPPWRFSKTKLLTCSPITGHWDVTHRIQHGLLNKVCCKLKSTHWLPIVTGLE
ncbi:hypothetical protein CDAR_14601 [Caerostris darwini]|uniref:Uncharacterized protein n=1 Tax=Caerostris darwini TaxID=1538125 RepID=A0AAV4RDN4_9ARAC|nr:hypothetical protein CDAR_14601 [Caerostris darwini]